MTKPSIPKGTRDFGPTEMVRRNYIFDIIKEVFELHGFLQIETPALENLSTLLGKYGDEGDKLVFKILNSGNFIENIPFELLSSDKYNILANQICEKGLRYDLTVPFARFVVQHRDSIVFPFKRYQIQPVWRADRPQKGRYREFFQCDADIVGSNSLLNEFELLQIIDEVFDKLKLNVTIKINNRKILSALSKKIGHPDKLIQITTAIDKIEKIGFENVKKELIDNGISNQGISLIEPILNLKGSNENKINTIKLILNEFEDGAKGIEELELLFEYLSSSPLKSEVELDLSLARGLNYYTGCIFEVKSNDAETGSISAGGRYDNLTSVFGIDGLSGVGISFGADRIYDVLTQTNRFPYTEACFTKVMFINFGKKETNYILPLIKKLRNKSINCELYPDNAKIKKQMAYADSKKIPFVIIAGESEMQQNIYTIKNMVSGEQMQMNEHKIIEFLTENV